MPITISLTEYKMSYPDTAQYPTLSQSGALGVLLEKRRFKAARLALRQAKRQARRQAVRVRVGGWWAKLRITVPRDANPAFVGVARNH